MQDVNTAAAKKSERPRNLVKKEMARLNLSGLKKIFFQRCR
jgi:hypothetical protein